MHWDMEHMQEVYGLQGLFIDKFPVLYYNITNGSHDWRVTQITAVECEHSMPTAWAIRFCGTGLSIFAFLGGFL